MKKEKYLTPMAEEIRLSHESFVCASAHLGDYPIHPASIGGLDMRGTDQLGLGSFDSFNLLSF